MIQSLFLFYFLYKLSEVNYDFKLASLQRLWILWNIQCYVNYGESLEFTAHRYSSNHTYSCLFHYKNFDYAGTGLNSAASLRLGLIYKANWT